MLNYLKVPVQTLFLSCPGAKQSREEGKNSAKFITENSGIDYIPPNMTPENDQNRQNDEILQNNEKNPMENEILKGESRNSEGESRKNEGESRKNEGESRKNEGESRKNEGESRLAEDESRKKEGEIEKLELCLFEEEKPKQMESSSPQPIPKPLKLEISSYPPPQKVIPEKIVQSPKEQRQIPKAQNVQSSIERSSNTQVNSPINKLPSDSKTTPRIM